MITRQDIIDHHDTGKSPELDEAMATFLGLTPFTTSGAAPGQAAAPVQRPETAGK